jgi:hypothetical protein
MICWAKEGELLTNKDILEHLTLDNIGFQSGKSTTDQLFALRQILEKSNEYNIQTHHFS